MGNTVWVRLEDVECYQCHLIFGMTTEYKKQKLNDRTSFYCPNGHRQNYINETHEARLQGELNESNSRMASERSARWAAEHKRDLAINAKKLAIKRIHMGVCPHCHRSFENVKLHMES